jgi:hypothetical protein
MEKVDVCINVFGKPWQTLCTLKSLMKHSGHLIDKIYLIKEKEQPYNTNIDWIFDYFDNLIIYTNEKYNFIKRDVNVFDENDILNIRYQFGFKKSDKKFIFITHNDVLYTDDIIGDMMSKIEDSVGIGEIGQCWNCPAFNDGVCSGEKFNDWNPTYDDILKLTLPYTRTGIFNINKDNPKPLPECRLNEWACLVNKEMINSETFPKSDTPFFGLYGLDLGTEWFRSMYLKGYKFIDYRKNFNHGFWADKAGHPTLINQNEYNASEETAKKYYEENFKL